MPKKPFDQLTQRGKVQRLRHIALEALTHYDIEITAVTFLTVATNTLFAVRTASGDKYALRISTPGEATIEATEVEMFWLAALKQDTDINVPHPVRRKDGQLVTYVTHPDVTETRRCVLFRWVPGRELEHYLTPENYHKLGRLMAQLHDHAEGLGSLPSALKPVRWDRVFYYYNEPIVYKTAAYAHLFPPERIDMLERVIAICNAALAETHQEKNGRFLIHGDLHYWNVHLYRSQLYALDFEDVMLGYPAQDVAITLSYGRDADGYPERIAAFEEGYKTLRLWPIVSKRQLETFIVARGATFANYAAHVLDEPEEYLTYRFEKMAAYLEEFA